MIHVLFGFSGRLSRAGFWEAVIGLVVGVAVLAILGAWGVDYASSQWLVDPEVGPWAVLGALALLALLTAWSLCAIFAKRLHDRGRPAWLGVLGLFPVLGWLWLLVDAGLLAGVRGANRYGPSPLDAVAAREPRPAKVKPARPSKPGKKTAPEFDPGWLYEPSFVAHGAAAAPAASGPSHPEIDWTGQAVLRPGPAPAAPAPAPVEAAPSTELPPWEAWKATPPSAVASAPSPIPAPVPAADEPWEPWKVAAPVAAAAEAAPRHMVDTPAANEPWEPWKVPASSRSTAAPTPSAPAASPPSPFEEPWEPWKIPPSAPAAATAPASTPAQDAPWEPWKVAPSEPVVPVATDPDPSPPKSWEPWVVAAAPVAAAAAAAVAHAVIEHRREQDEHRGHDQEGAPAHAPAAPDRHQFEAPQPPVYAFDADTSDRGHVDHRHAAREAARAALEHIQAGLEQGRAAMTHAAQAAVGAHEADGASG